MSKYKYFIDINEFTLICNLNFQRIKKETEEESEKEEWTEEVRGKT